MTIGKTHPQSSLAIVEIPRELLPAETDVWLSQPDVQKRYGVTSMCLHRWRKKRPDMGFPQGLVINGRRYFKLADLLEFERRMAKKAAALVDQPRLSKNGKPLGRPRKEMQVA